MSRLSNFIHTPLLGGGVSAARIASYGVGSGGGIAGDTGPQGVQGDTGPDGIDGPQGPPGVSLFPGPQGIQGETGPVGPTGPTGSNGIIGDTGSTGTTGSVGPTGADGRFGSIEFPYIYSGLTTSAFPGTGYLRFNNSDLTVSTKLFISGYTSSGSNVIEYLDSIDDSTTTLKGHFKVSKSEGEWEMCVVNLSTQTGAGGVWFDIDHTHLNISSGINPFSSGDNVTLTVTRTGDKGLKGPIGVTGATGSSGSNGPQGITGSTGTQGRAGNTGSSGPAGSQGITGPSGDALMLGPFSDSVFLIRDDVTASKRFAVQVAGLSSLSTRVIEVPDHPSILPAVPANGSLQIGQATYVGFSTNNVTLGPGAGAQLSNVGNTIFGYNSSAFQPGVLNTVVLGNEAGRNINGQSNVFLGSAAGQVVSNCSYNVGVGYDTLNGSLSDQFNVAVGWKAGTSNNASSSTMVGANVVNSGVSSVLVGSNTIVGYGAGSTFVGDYSTFLGARAYFNNTAGSDYMCVMGYNADGGGGSKSHSNCLIVGANACLTTPNVVSPIVVIGSNATTTTNLANKVLIGTGNPDTSATGDSFVVAGSTSITGMYFPDLESSTGTSSLLYFVPTTGRIQRYLYPVNTSTVILGPGTLDNTGTNNVILGVNARAFSTGGSGSIVIGASATGSADNAIVLGTSQTSFKIPPLPGPYSSSTDAISNGLIPGMLYWSTGSSADTRDMYITY